MLLAVQDVTLSTNQEFPFFLYGKEIGNNQIEFNEFMSASNNRQNALASFNQSMINDLQNTSSFMQMNEDNPVFKTRQLERISCLVTSTGDINFVFYDNANQNFYRFTNVIVKGKDNVCKPVNCYGVKQIE